MKIQHNRSDLFVYDKKRNNSDRSWYYQPRPITQVYSEKTRKYDLIVNELALTYKCKVNIIPYVMTWEGLVMKYHKKRREDIGIAPRTEAYIQSLLLKKTFESISFDRRRGLEEDCKVQEEVEDLASKIVEAASEVVKPDIQAN